MPAWDAEIGQPIDSVASANPATTGPRPSTSCTYVGTYEVSPSTIAPTPAAMRLLATSSRRRNTHSGRTGSIAVRSTIPKPTSSSTPAEKIAMLCGESHAQA